MKRLMSLIALLIAANLSMSATSGGEKSTYEKESKHDFQKTVELIKQEATKAGWSIPAEHDMQATLKKKNKEVLPAYILVLCNADFAFQFLKNDDTRKAQSLLPCRIAVYEKTDGKTYLSWTNYEKAGKEMGDSAASVFKKISAGLEDITHPVVK